MLPRNSFDTPNSAGSGEREDLAGKSPRANDDIENVNSTFKTKGVLCRRD